MSLWKTPLKTSLLTLVSGVIIGAAAVGATALAGNQVTTSLAAPVLYDELKVVDLYQTASPATVEISIGMRSGFNGRLRKTGQGSGFVVDQEGNILTNYHVIEGASTVSVIFADKTTATAQIIATSPPEDLAVLRVGADKVKAITPLPLGNSSLVRPGQMAIAIGSPYGYGNSITVGVISGVRRTIRSNGGSTIRGALQTDASIHPGNSGGPLLNSSGQVVGINTAVEAGHNGATGVGFAVPVNTAKDFLARAKSGAATAASRPWLGITGTALTPDVAQYVGLSIDKGVLLIAVTSGSPADKVGLQGGSSVRSAGDVITSINGADVGSVEELKTQLTEYQPGDTVTLAVMRAGKAQQIEVTLGQWPD